MSRLVLPELESRFAVWGLYWQELHRYWQRGASLNATCWYYRDGSMQIAQKSPCEVAIAAKPDSPGYHYQFRPCQLSSRVVDLSAINGTHGTLNPRTEITLNVTSRRYIHISTSTFLIVFCNCNLFLCFAILQHNRFFSILG